VTHLSQKLLLLSIVFGTAWGVRAASPDGSPDSKFYQVVDGKVDARTYNGFRRYHAVCNHCHGPDGTGSTFGPSLVDKLTDVNAFRRVVREGQRNGTSIMKGFAKDPNVSPYIDDIYAYLQARADGALGRGRPTKLEQ
jgi:mono/diheme cytochrome c family protein